MNMGVRNRRNRGNDKDKRSGGEEKRRLYWGEDNKV